MKKLIYFILILLLINNICYADEICNSHEDVLKKIGFIDEIRQKNELLTRSECVTLAAKILTLNGDVGMKDYPYYSAVLDISVAEIYPDISKDREDYMLFNNLYSPCYNSHIQEQRIGCHWVFLKYIEGDGIGMRPDDYITWPEFVTLFMRVANWDVFLYLDNDHNYPDSYINIAKKIGLYPIKETGYVTFGEACDFFYNYLQSPYVAYSGGYRLPNNIPYVVKERSWILNYINLAEEFVENEQQETELRVKYNIDTETPLKENNVVIFYIYPNAYPYTMGNDYSVIETLAITLNDTFEYKGYENGIPEKMISPEIIK